MAKKKSEIKDIPEKIIGRVKEQELLKDLIGSKKSEFIAVYERRRIGKTYLAVFGMMGTIDVEF